jgi:hypothetical protein
MIRECMFQSSETLLVHSLEQVMLDVTGQQELSDYCRLCVFNTSDPNAKTVVRCTWAAGAATAIRPAICDACMWCD